MSLGNGRREGVARPQAEPTVGGGGGVAIEVVGLARFWLTRLLCLSKLFHIINILWLILVTLILYNIDG